LSGELLEGVNEGGHNVVVQVLSDWQLRVDWLSLSVFLFLFFLLTVVLRHF